MIRAPHAPPRPPSPRRLALAAVVLGVLGAQLGVVVPAGAQAPPSTGPAPVATSGPAPGPEPGPAPPPAAPPAPAIGAERTAAERALVERAIRLARTRAELTDVERDLTGTATRLAEAERALAEAEGRLTAARRELAEVRARLLARAAVVYQRHSDRLGMALAVNRVVDLSAGNHYAESLAVVDNREIDRLEGLVGDLEAERARRETVRRELADAKAGLEQRRAELVALADREAAELERMGGVPVMGPSVLTAAEIAAWFRSTGQRARLSGSTTIDELAAMFVEEGAAENIRGDLAFAQAVLETGSFGNALDNNYAGIGACDSCTSEYLFPTPRDGVRAQIQLLRNYADPTSRADRLAHPPDPTLYGTDPVRAAYLFDTFPYKGRAPLWNVMGNGNWATDPLYAGKVLSIYSRMLAFKAGQLS